MVRANHISHPYSHIFQPERERRKCLCTVLLIKVAFFAADGLARGEEGTMYHVLRGGIIIFPCPPGSSYHQLIQTQSQMPEIF
jgi:hypothetical protein